MTVRTVVAADTSFLVREQGGGSGTPVLLLHGVPETSTCWRQVAPRLASGRRVLAPDLPGLGGSSYGGPYDVPSLVRQLGALVDTLLEETGTAGGRVDVVGHDWGGSLALALSGARPGLVRRLVVANAPFRQVPLRALHIPLFALPVVPEALFRLGGRRTVRGMLALGWRSAVPLDDGARAEYEAAYTRPESVRAMLGYYREATRPRVAAALARRRPAGRPRVQAERALVLWGARDPVLPISTGESVVRDLGAGCSMVTVPGAGHFVVEEAADVVADVLADFLADDAAPAAEPVAPPESGREPRVDGPPAGAGEPDAPTVGPVPVGGTTATGQGAATKAPATKAPATKAPARKAARRTPPAGP